MESFSGDMDDFNETVVKATIIYRAHLLAVILRLEIISCFTLLDVASNENNSTHENWSIRGSLAT